MNLNTKMIEIIQRTYNLACFLDNELPFQEISHLKKYIKES